MKLTAQKPASPQPSLISSSTGRNETLSPKTSRDQNAEGTPARLTGAALAKQKSFLV